MSRLNPYQNTLSPAVCRWSWKGGDGTLQWYDKQADGGKGENIIERLPFKFLFLDETAVVTGFDEEKESFLFSNEVKDTTTQPFVVKWQKKGLGVAASGMWRAIKAAVKGHGGSYACKVYIAFKDEGRLKIGTITMSGCARSAWIEFKNQARGDINKKAVAMAAGEEVSNPKNKRIVYTPPVFTIHDVLPETDKEALELCREVEAYLAERMKRPVAAEADATAHEPHPPAEADSDGPDADGPAEDENVPF
jgi:hypothetical protein